MFFYLFLFIILGDIMGGCETRVSVGEDGEMLTPLDRIVLTANGNLQRIMRFVI